MPDCIGPYEQNPTLTNDPVTDAIQDLYNKYNYLETNLSDVILNFYKNMKNNNRFDNIVYIGDSYLAGDGLADTRGGDYAGNPETDTYADIFSGLVGCTTYRKYANGGMGFVAQGSNGYNLDAYVKNVIQQDFAPGSTAAQDVTAVIIVLGINDQTQSSDNILTLGDAALRTIQNLFVNATVTLFFSPVYMATQARARPKYKVAAMDKTPVFCPNSAVWGIGQLEYYTYGQYIYGNGTIQDTTGHPNLKGMWLIARQMSKFFHGEDYATERRYYFAKSGSTSTMVSGNVGAYIYFNGDMVSIRIEGGTIGTGWDIITDNSIDESIRPLENVMIPLIVQDAYIAAGCLFTWNGNLILYKCGSGGASENIESGFYADLSIPFDTWVGER